MPRALLALIAAAILWGSAVTSWAAAGFVGESECCCPVKAECRCHDHDGQPPPDATMKRCGGQAELIAPVAVVAIEPDAPAIVPIPLAITPVLYAIAQLVGALPQPPETPPF